MVQVNNETYYGIIALSENNEWKFTLEVGKKMSESRNNALNNDNIHEERTRHGKRRKKPRKLGCLSIGGLVLLLIIGLFAFKLWDIWSSVESTVKKIQIPRAENQVQIRPEPVVVKERQAFSVLLLGIDTGDYGRVEQGRSDVMLLATVNPKTNRTTLTSIPRDSYVSIPGRSEKTKINHAYAYGGPGLAANTVQELLDVPVDFTVSADMQGFKQIIDAVGGITIAPLASFSQGRYNFQKGVTTRMDGEMVLSYIRNRYDSGGDYGRQDRARQVVLEIIRSGVELDSLLNYQDILDSISGNVKMDLSYDEIIHIATNNSSAIRDIEEFQLQGSGEMIDGVYYEILHSESLQAIQEALKKELDIAN